jgi:flagellar basal body-associated protein FliL
MPIHNAKVKTLHNQHPQRNQNKQMEEKQMKKKLILGILASALSLTLAISGTLMLFTATSETATNVVTLGNASIKMQEAKADDPDTDANEGEYQDVTEGFELNFGTNVVPGAKLTKKPRVVNTGTVPVYVYVEGTIIAKKGEDVLDLTTGDPLDKEDSAQVYQDLRSVIASVVSNVKPGWVYEDGNGAGGYFVYADASGKLTSLSADDETSDIFDTVIIPSAVGNALAGYEISLQLKAYAVQSENNDAKDLSGLIAQFVPVTTTPAPIGE